MILYDDVQFEFCLNWFTVELELWTPAM